MGDTATVTAAQGTLVLLGEPNGPHNPTPDPGKVRFVSSVLDALGGKDLGKNSSDYGYGGEWVTSNSTLDQADLLELALEAYYQYVGLQPSPNLWHEAHWIASRPTGWVGDGLQPVFAPADVVDALAGLRSTLESWGWTAQTSADRNFTRGFRKSQGQCAVTALLVQDRAGGDLVRVELDASDVLGRPTRVSHYFNRLPSGHVVDLTRDQFDRYEPVAPAQLRERAYVLSHPDTRDRYVRLCANVSTDPVL